MHLIGVQSSGSDADFATRSGDFPGDRTIGHSVLPRLAEFAIG
jgi:hypothetical protein